MKTPITSIKRLALALCLATPFVSWAATPYAVWDGAVEEFNFNVLTRRGYTLGNLGGSYANTVAGDGSYLQVGNNNAKAAITLVKSDGSAMGASTIIMKCENLPAADSYNRAVAAFMHSGENNGSHAYIGIARMKNGTISETSYTGASVYIWKGEVWSSNYVIVDPVDGTFVPPSEGSKTIALGYSEAAGTSYWVDGTNVGSRSDLKASGYAPTGVVIGGVDTDNNGKFYPMVGMKIKAIAFFGEKLSDEDVAAFKFPSENQMLTMTELNALTAAGEDDSVDKSFTTIVTMGAEDEAPSADTKALLQDASWRGIVRMDGVTLGEGTLADFGNSGSSISLVGGGVTNDQLVANCTFAGKLVGSGDLTITATPTTQYSINLTGDCTAFAGSVTIPASGNARVVFGSQNVAGNGNCLVVAADATVTVAAGKTWTAPGGFVIRGTVNLVGNFNSGNDRVYGDTGIIVVSSATARTNLKIADTFSGTVKIAYDPGNSRFVLNDFASATDLNSTVEIVGVNGAFTAFPYSAWSGGSAPTIKPAVVLSSNWTVSDGSAGTANVTTFKKLSGSGNLIVNGTISGDNEIYYTIEELSNFTGTLGGRRGKFTINKLVVASEPTPGTKLVNCTATFAPNIDNTEVYYNNAKVEDIELEFKAGDGIYVAEPDYVAYTITKAWDYSDPQNPFSFDVTNNFETIEAAIDSKANKIYLIDDEIEVPEGWEKSLEGEVYVLTPVLAVAYVDGMNQEHGYTDFAEAIAAATASGTHSLIVASAQTLDSLTVPAGCTLTVTVVGGSLSLGAATIESGATLKISGIPSAYTVSGALELVSGNFTGTTVTLADAAATCLLKSNATGVTAESITASVSGTVVSSGDANGVTYSVEAPSGTYVITGETELDETGSITVPVDTTAITLGGHDVTAGFSIDGTTATLNDPEVVEDEDKAINIGATTVTLNVDLVPGLYYGIASGTGLTLTRPETLTQYTGSNDADILTVTKPSDAKGFFKVFVDIKQ